MVFAILTVLTLLIPEVVLAAAIELSESQPQQGHIVRVTVPGVKDCEPRLTWKNERIQLRKRGKNWRGYLGIGLEIPPGPKPLHLERKCPGGTKDHRTEITVQPGDYPVQRLTVEDTGKVSLSEADLRRHRRESQQIDDALGRRTEEQYWELPFHPPVRESKFGPGDSFGSRRIINGKPRSPHSGEDYDADVGDPVFAINDGRVVLIGDFFFSGKGVFVDHGHGLISMYFHLSEITVSEGEFVQGGDRVAAAGATGRVTGPHLHLGVQWRNARVDPDLFFFGNESLFHPDR